MQARGPEFKYPALKRISGCSSNPDRLDTGRLLGLASCRLVSSGRDAGHVFPGFGPLIQGKEELIHIFKRSEMILFEAN